jgi:hypothetical protein
MKANKKSTSKKVGGTISRDQEDLSREEDSQSVVFLRASKSNNQPAGRPNPIQKPPVEIDLTSNSSINNKKRKRESRSAITTQSEPQYISVESIRDSTANEQVTLIADSSNNTNNADSSISQSIIMIGRLLEDATISDTSIRKK